MPNLLTLKTIFYEPKDKKFYSPSHTGFAWQPGIVGRRCSRGCTQNHFNPECTCGIYGSPNPEALNEYASFSTSVFVLMNTYGWTDVWSAPEDVGYAYVTRSWGVRIIGVVTTDFETGHVLDKKRQLSSIMICQKFNVRGYRWATARDMIQLTWKRENERLGNQKFPVYDPYDEGLWKLLDGIWEWKPDETV